MQPSADEDNDDVIESFWLYIFSVFPSFVYYYLVSYKFEMRVNEMLAMVLLHFFIKL